MSQHIPLYSTLHYILLSPCSFCVTCSFWTQKTLEQLSLCFAIATVTQFSHVTSSQSPCTLSAICSFWIQKNLEHFSLCFARATVMPFSHVTFSHLESNIFLNGLLLTALHVWSPSEQKIDVYCIHIHALINSLIVHTNKCTSIKINTFA